MATRLLLIEDNPANLELMRYLLAAHGYEILVAGDGEAGLDVLKRELPDLVICDVQMPGVDGFEVLRRLKESPTLQNLCVIAVTAFAMVGDRDRVLAAGFDGYLPKPITPETFVHEVEAFLPPALRSGVKTASLADGASSRPHPPEHTVLVVDDVPVNLDLWESLLGHSGFRVVTAAGMHDALMQARLVVPDLILSDVCMNQGSGYDLVRELKNEPRLRSVPVILITSTVTNEQARAKGLALGVARFLFRPIEPQILLDEVRACLQERVVAAGPLKADGFDTTATTAPGEQPALRRTVLVLDDEPNNLMLLRILLERAGYKVFVAANAAQALGVLRASPPDLILSDVNMPQDDGFRLLAEVRADPGLQSVIFAFVSASEWDARARERALQLGADRFFLRPSDLEHLIVEINACLGVSARN